MTSFTKKVVVALASVAVIAGNDEFAQGMWKVKDLAKREEQAVSEKDLVEKIYGLLKEH